MSNFDDSRQMVFVCDHVLSQSELVRLVVHDEDDKWTFMCGSESDDGDELHYVPLSYVLDPDPSLGSIAALEPGMIASRGSVDAGWDQGSLYEDDD